MKKLLLIDDDQVVTSIYRKKFTAEGFQVETAVDGEAGLALARSFLPDAIVLDLMLPKLSGVEVLKALRADDGLKGIPVVVLSNAYLGPVVEEARRAGANECLAKTNCPPNKVVQVVRSVLPAAAASQPAAAKPAATAAPDQAHHAPPPPTTQTDDEQFQAELRKSFIERLPAALAAFQMLLQELVKSQGQSQRLLLLHQLHAKIRALTGSAGLVGMQQIAQMTAALEVLIKELHDKPKNFNASTLRTVTAAIDFLGVLFDRAAQDGMEEVPTANVLVVDDEPISRRAVNYALEKTNLKSISTEDPQSALDLLGRNRFDLIILDVNMPGMTGFELCTKIRTLPVHAKTPVIFVTGLTDFESHARSLASGGNDLIAKPFLFIELAVKALLCVLRSRLGPEKK